MLRAWLTSFWQYAFLRFLVIGALNTAFGYAVFAAFILLGLAPPLALLMSTVIGVLFNFQTTGGLVFGNRDHRLLLKFIGVYVVVYLLNYGLLRFWSEQVGLGPLWGQALSIPVVVVLAFLMMRTLIFAKKPVHGKDPAETH